MVAQPSPRITPGEWRWLLIASVVLLALVILPVIVITSATPEGYHFSGFMVNARDGHSYLAKMRQGYRGEWVYTLPYTAEPHDGIAAFPLYLGMGHLARLIPLPLATYYHLARLLCGALALVSGYLFVAHMTEEVALRRWMWFLFAIGSGLGLFTVPFGIDSVDLSIPEAFTFLGMLTNPHFPLTTAMMAVLLLLVFAVPQMPPAGRVGLLFALGVLLALTAPFAAPLIGAALAAGVLAQWRQDNRWPWRTAIWAAIVIGAIGLVGLYDVVTMLVNPAIGEWSRQNQTPSPPLIEYLLGFGALLPLAAIGAWRRWRNGFPLLWALLGWLAAVLILVYAPLSLQRRMVTGIQLPLSVLGGFGIVWLLGKLPSLGRLVMLSGLLLVLLPTNVLLLAAILASPSQLDPLAFYTEDEYAALQWLGEHAAPGDVVLSSVSFGNFVPAWSNARVVYGHPFEVLDGEQKLAWVEDYYGGQMSLDERNDMFTDQHITWVVVGPREQELAVTGSPLLDGLTPIWSSGEITIYAAPE